MSVAAKSLHYVSVKVCARYNKGICDQQLLILQNYAYPPKMTTIDFNESCLMRLTTYLAKMRRTVLPNADDDIIMIVPSIEVQTVLYDEYRTDLPTQSTIT